MNAAIRLTIGLCVILALTFGVVSSAVAAPAGADGLPVLNKITFVHYSDQAAARDAAPAKPANSGKPLYKYSGIHWDDSSIPVKYEIDSSDGSSFNQSFRYGLEASFNTWQADGGSYIRFTCGTDNWSDWDYIPSSFIGGGSRNGFNELGWASLESSYPNAIAVTMIWYGRDKHIVEVDTAMSTDLLWTQNVVDGDPNTHTGSAGYYDVQDIMTHEAGHWLMLGDLYTNAASQQTMYGYGSMGELKARTLESGDVAGLRKIYPGDTKPSP